jgi:hypothetical protein
VIVAIGPAQQVKLDEAGQLVEIGVPAKPTALELLLVAFDNFEAIHCDVHSCSPLRRPRAIISPFREHAAVRTHSVIVGVRGEKIDESVTPKMRPAAVGRYRQLLHAIYI